MRSDVSLEMKQLPLRQPEAQSLNADANLANAQPPHELVHFHL